LSSTSTLPGPKGDRCGLNRQERISPVSEFGREQTFRGYDVRREVWQIGGRPIDLTRPANVDALLDLPRTHERFARNEYMPYWAQPWPAGIMMAEYILGHQSRPGLRAVEIGCGIGLVSVAAALVGWRVTASDYDEDALAFAELNAARNNVILESTQLVDFVEAPPTVQYDRVLAADVLYERRLTDPVARWMASALGPGGQALVSDPNRAAADGFSDALAGCGLKAEVEQVSTTAPAGLVSRGRIWQIRWQTSANSDRAHGGSQ
jgi:2-polyprenyl-3-methyl-5-hydroxy-6-metoxy-1,4-benzoquinol methylase